jgi:Predicted transcriptional regulator
MTKKMGQRIKEVREKLNLTQAAFGELLGKTGNTIARWERNEVHFDSPKILELALVALENEALAEKQLAALTEMQRETSALLQKNKEVFARINQQ